MNTGQSIVLIRGGGDLATGIAARLHRSGISIIITEVQKPRAVRRLVALAQAVYSREVLIEDLQGKLVQTTAEALASNKNGEIPVMVDSDAEICREIQILAIIDARMKKRPPEYSLDIAPLVVGVGPGFTAGLDCHAVVETNRGHHLGRVFWEGTAESDTGIPGSVSGHDIDRVLRAPAPGNLVGKVALGDEVKAGDTIATISGVHLMAPFDGILRGLIHESVDVKLGEKVGDVDPRGDPSFCSRISDKALAVGGGILEALLSKQEIRCQIWD